MFGVVGNRKHTHPPGALNVRAAVLPPDKADVPETFDVACNVELP